METEGFTTEQLNSLAKLKSFIPEIYEINEIEKTGNKNSYILEESFEIISSVRSKLTLEGVESLGEWENQNYYFAYRSPYVLEVQYNNQKLF